MVNSRLMQILTLDEIRRITITEKTGEQVRIVVDVHGMKCYQARRLINNIINAARSVFHLLVIHGYHRGTAIKDMLARDFSNIHIVERYVDFYNEGLTHMIVTE